VGSIKQKVAVSPTQNCSWKSYSVKATIVSTPKQPLMILVEEDVIMAVTK